MLIDDRKKTVELYVENILWGNITLTSKDSQYAFDTEKLNIFKSNMEKWMRMRNGETKSQECEELIDAIYERILHYRVRGMLQGQLQDRDADQKIEELKSDNLQLARQLSQAYIPPKDNKIGTN